MKLLALFHAKFGKMQALVCLTTMMMNVIRSLSQFDVICLECLAWSTWGCFLGCLPTRQTSFNINFLALYFQSFSLGVSFPC